MGICFSARLTIHDNHPMEFHGRNEGPPDKQPMNTRIGGGNIAAGFPSRPQEKVKALVDLIERLKPGQVSDDLLLYANTALDYTCHYLPNHFITDLDIHNISLLANAYNKTLNGLNLECFDSREGFVRRLGENGDKAWRALIGLSPASYHYVAADIRQHSNGNKTVVILEPESVSNNRRSGKQQDYYALKNEVFANSGSKCVMSVVEVGAQKLNVDSVIFSLNFALKSHKNPDCFNQLHQALAENGRSLPFSDTASRIEMGMEIIDGKKILPAQFYKHAHSNRVIEAVKSVQPDRKAENVRTSNSTASPETLSVHHRSFRVFRNVAEAAVSISIDTSRLTKIRKAINSELRSQSELISQVGSPQTISRPA